MGGAHPLLPLTIAPLYTILHMPGCLIYAPVVLTVMDVCDLGIPILEIWCTNNIYLKLPFAATRSAEHPIKEQASAIAGWTQAFSLGSIGPEANLLCPRLHPIDPRFHPIGPRLHPIGPRLHPIGPRLHPIGPRFHPIGPRLHPIGPRLHPIGPRLHPIGILSHVL